MSAASFAALAAGLAVLLVVPPAAGPAVASSRAAGTLRLVGPGAAAAALAGGVVVLLDGARLVAGLAGVACLAGVARAARQRRADRDRDRRRGLVVDVGDAMVGELRAGRPPLQALQRAGEVWPDLATVAAAARLGADVPAALREVSRRPGAEGLADLAAAWQVSTGSGAALASSLAQVVASARARQHASTLVLGELASARATARLVALLPVGTLAMASGIGATPWTFLVDQPLGAGCLLAGVLLVLLGLAWIDRIASSVLGR